MILWSALSDCVGHQLRRRFACKARQQITINIISVFREAIDVGQEVAS